MSSSTAPAPAIPAAAAAANEATLNQAMAAASIDDKATSSKDGSNEEDLEDGEIKDDEEEEEDDGRVKTVFDDARRFNVKVSWLAWMHLGALAIHLHSSTHYIPNGHSILTRPSQSYYPKRHHQLQLHHK
jgi:hypothetical protein